MAKLHKEKNIATSIVPVIHLSIPERLWMAEVYSRKKKGVKFSIREIWGNLHEQLPAKFYPGEMDERLISGNGEEIRLLGVVALEENFTILEKVNTIITTIRNILLNTHEKRNINIAEIAQKCSLSVEEISFALHLVTDYGRFYTGVSFEAENTLIKSIDIGESDEVYYGYIRFPGIEQLIELKSYESYVQPGEKFTMDEMMSMSQKLDSVLQELQTLKIGQEIIWTDVSKELNELKTHFILNKKNWRQLFFGKMFEMVASGIISEAVSRRIVEALNPIVRKLLT